MKPKKELRSGLIKQRKTISAEQKKKWDDLIAESVISHPWYEKAGTIALYADFNGEAATGRILKDILLKGKNAAMPRVEGKAMGFYLISGPDDLVPGTWGIREPKESCLPAEKIDLMIMPCVGFDEERNRLGYGGGYYDRYLAGYREKTGVLPKTCAIAYEMQKAEKIPSEDTDIRPDIVVTPVRTII